MPVIMFSIADEATTTEIDTTTTPAPTTTTGLNCVGPSSELYKRWLRKPGNQSLWSNDSNILLPVNSSNVKRF